MTPRIIPHGLAADVLRVLHGRYGWQRDDDSLELWSADGSTWARIPLCDVDADGAPVLFYRTGADAKVLIEEIDYTTLGDAVAGAEEWMVRRG